jgi:hypothetical protein
MTPTEHVFYRRRPPLSYARTPATPTMSTMRGLTGFVVHTKQVKPDRKDCHPGPLPMFRSLDGIKSLHDDHWTREGATGTRTTPMAASLTPSRPEYERGPAHSWAQGQLFRSGSLGKLDLQFPAKLAFVRGLYCGDKRSPFGHAAKNIAPVGILRIADHDHIGIGRSNFDTLAIAQAVTGCTPARVNQTRSRQQHAPSHHFFVREW